MQPPTGHCFDLFTSVGVLWQAGAEEVAAKATSSELVGGIISSATEGIKETKEAEADAKSDA